MKSGSFQVLMNAVANGAVGLFWTVIKQLYATYDAQTAMAVVETLFTVATVTGAGCAGVVKFLKWRQGRHIDRWYVRHRGR
jgi:hypothetical protein